jgi:hypothetical protein
VLSVVAAMGALFGAFIALVGRALCESSDNGCSGPGWFLDTQLIVALIGLIPAGAFVYFSFSDSRKRALISLLAGLVIWAAWGALVTHRFR